MPHRINIKDPDRSDSLFVEITIDKANDLVYRCLFAPEQLVGRRSVTFRVSGEQVYWLSGLQPKPLLKQQADKLVPDVEHVEEVGPKDAAANRAPESVRCWYLMKKDGLKRCCAL